MSRSRDADRPLVERAVHDLLNPVSAILGLGETLLSRGASLDDETLRSFGGSIARQATRLERAIRDLAVTERLMEGDPRVAAAEVVLEDVLGSLASERVRVDVAPGTVARADPDHLIDAVGRLVDNALEFSKGEVVVSAGGGGDDPWIEVTDRGTGFAPSLLAAAFEPFTAGSNARSERGPGLGLGLYIARRLVEANGGMITLSSEPGAGSRFRIDLPG